MTLDKLLGYSAADLEALSDAELEAMFLPYLKWSRPDQAPKVFKAGNKLLAGASGQSQKSQLAHASAKAAAAVDMLKLFLDKNPVFKQ